MDNILKEKILDVILKIKNVHFFSGNLMSNLNKEVSIELYSHLIKLQGLITYLNDPKLSTLFTNIDLELRYLNYNEGVLFLSRVIPPIDIIVSSLNSQNESSNQLDAPSKPKGNSPLEIPFDRILLPANIQNLVNPQLVNAKEKLAQGNTKASLDILRAIFAEHQISDKAIISYLNRLNTNKGMFYEGKIAINEFNATNNLITASLLIFIESLTQQ